MSGQSPCPPSSTLLIVEDADTCATTLEMAFCGMPGIEVVLASTAMEALIVLRDERRSICAVITDLNMPQMNGFELIERIRASGRHARIPIIVVSGDTDPRTPDRIRRLGADAYFEKPYSPSRVREKLEQLLNANQTHPC
jgi:CheY-like chemotaxis protein